MAHFYGGIHGSRGIATRLGTARSGLNTFSASWEGQVTVALYEKDGKDYARVSLRPWHGAGVDRELYNGPVGGT